MVDLETVEGMQEAIDSGIVWRLEGAAGRAAMAALQAGVCVLGPEAHTDYWGNRIPSRFEVKAGTVGSVEYAEAAQGE